MPKLYRFYIFENAVPTVQEMTPKEMVLFIKVFGDKFEIMLVE